MTFTIRIGTGNAAFELRDDNDRLLRGINGSEVARILRDAADRFDRPIVEPTEMDRILMDINGNAVGSVRAGL